MPRFRDLSWLLPLLFVIQFGSSQESLPVGKIKALLIGNSKYAELPPCPTSKNNLQVLATALSTLGVSPMVVPDADAKQLVAAIDKFKNGVAPDEVALIYYSGFTVQSEGDNFLLPVDFPADKGDLDSQAISLANIEFRLKGKGIQSRIFFLEAARDNPLESRFPGRGLTMGYAYSTGTVLSFADRPFTVAPATDKPVDVFTQALADVLQEPGLTTERFCERVQAKVIAATGGNQVPTALTAMLMSRFYLTGEPKKTVTTGRSIDTAPRTNPQDKQEYVWIPAGSFQMGCVPGDKQCKPDEMPRHKVTIKGFWLGRAEVDVGTYKRYTTLVKKKMPKAPDIYKKSWANESLPMVEVSWSDAKAFCGWAGGRLPTEAEWEYAARSGVDGLPYPWPNGLSHDRANFAGVGGYDTYPDAAPVRKFEPSAWNLYDMSGNVWEWCADWYAADFYSKSIPAPPPRSPEGNAEDPQNQTAAKDHVKRGGSYHSAENELRLSYRGHFNAADNNTGIRCVVDKFGNQ